MGEALPGVPLPLELWHMLYLLILIPLSDQHLHDPPVQLRQRPLGVLHLREPGQLRAELDQPALADAAAPAAGPQVLRALPGAEGPALAGNTGVGGGDPLRGPGRETASTDWEEELSCREYSRRLAHAALSNGFLLFNDAFCLFDGLSVSFFCCVIFLRFRLVGDFCIENVV